MPKKINDHDEGGWAGMSKADLWANLSSVLLRQTSGHLGGVQPVALFGALPWTSVPEHGLQGRQYATQHQRPSGLG